MLKRNEVIRKGIEKGFNTEYALRNLHNLRRYIDAGMEFDDSVYCIIEANKDMTKVITDKKVIKEIMKSH